VLSDTEPFWKGDPLDRKFRRMRGLHSGYFDIAALDRDAGRKPFPPERVMSSALTSSEKPLAAPPNVGSVVRGGRGFDPLSQ
jgi:hypothetical protein